VSDWPFDQTPGTAALTVRAVLDGAPILHVSHDEDITAGSSWTANRSTSMTAA